MSYSYEPSNVRSGGMAIPPGPSPESDNPGALCGSHRNVRLWLRKFYADRPPIVRCLHHPDKDEPIALNLSLDGTIYASGPLWERDPEVLAEFASRAARDLTTDSVAFEGNWRLSGISATADGWGIAARSEIASGAIAELTKAMRLKADSLKDRADAERTAGRLFLFLRDYAAAEAAAIAVLVRPDHAVEQGAGHRVPRPIAQTP